MGKNFPFTYRLNGPHRANLFASVVISENQWFNGVFQGQRLTSAQLTADRNVCFTLRLRGCARDGNGDAAAAHYF